MVSFVDIHTHNPHCDTERIANFRLGVDTIAPTTPFSAGIHPWDAEVVTKQRDRLLAQLADCECVAIGEVGLDKACKVPLGVQRELFEAQLTIAAERNLPVIVHCVRATSECLTLLAKHNIQKALFHGFIGSVEVAKEILSKGYFISYGFGAIRSPKTIEALRHTPLDHLFLESDTAPHPIGELYAAATEIKGIDIELLKDTIKDNYTTFFR